jgi:hypothetical protein
MKLKKLEIKYFKKIEDKTFNFAEGKNVIIGHNECGKTSTFDAISWLMFGKDSVGSSKFRVKTHDLEGIDIPDVDTTVSATFILDDGKELFLKRGIIQKRKNYVNEFWIGEDKVTSTEFNTTIATLIGDKDLFRILSDAAYFCSPLFKWEDRRKFLLGLVGGDNTKKILLSQKKYELIGEGLRENDTERLLKRYKDRKAELEGALTRLPIEIDVKYASLEELELGDMSEDELITAVYGLETDIALEIADKAYARSENHKSNLAYHKLQNRLTDIDRAMSAITQRATKQANIDMQNQFKVVRDLQFERDNLTRSKLHDQSELSQAYSELEGYKETLADCINIISNAKQTKFTLNSEDTTCPTCNQSLPNQRDVVAKLSKNFFLERDKLISKTQESVDMIQKYIERSVKAIKGYVSNTTSYGVKISTNSEELAKANELSMALQDFRVDPTELDDNQPLIAERDTLNAKNLEIVQFDGSEYDLKIQELELELTACKDSQKVYEVHDNMGKAIDVLESVLEGLNDEDARLDMNTDLCKEYIKRSASMLSNKVNKLFTDVKFEMFEMQKNGIPKPACNAISKGDTWGNWSQSQKARVGIHVIEVIGKLKGLQVPVWIEDAGIIFGIETDLQTIELDATDLNTTPLQMKG